MDTEFSSVPPRKRRRSPYPSPSPSRSPRSSSPRRSDDGGGKRRRTDLTVPVCKEFIRNVCRRSESGCKFAHPHSAVSVERDTVVACADSLRNKCFRGRTCRYYHPPPHLQESLLKAIGVEDPKVVMICRDFARGQCRRAAKECRFAHHSSIDDSVIICQDFLRGTCERKSCRYSHDTARRASQVHMPDYAMPMQLPKSPPRTQNDREILEVCRDFLKNLCNRDTCKYLHPGSGIKVIDNQVEVCRDFRRGVCHRNSCRFYHPSTTMDVGK